jgi:hypothetical protein
VQPSVERTRSGHAALFMPRGFWGTLPDAMPDEADELILKMQHLEAQARAQREAQRLADSGKSLKSRAQQVAWAAQADLSAAEAQQRDAEEKLQRARDPALKATAAADLLEEGRRLAEDARARIVKSRAKLNFALDQMDEAERREYEELRAEARAEAHGQIADDPLFKGSAAVPAPSAPPSSATPAAASAPSSSPSSSSPPSNPGPASSPTTPPKTLGRRRPKGS